MTKPPSFSKSTIDFLKKASRQKNPAWLEKNQTEYEKVVLEPLRHLAKVLKTELQPLARHYNFPQKGIGRLKRSANRAKEYGSLYKGWLSYSAARPRESRFEHNPNLFFLVNPDDTKDPVLLAGGLYMPSSRQLRTIREALDKDGSAFDRLFASKDFARCFPGGFSDERIAKRPPRGYDPNHRRMSWLKLQAFFVWRPYSRHEFASRDFSQLVVRDCRQILRLNTLLEQVLGGHVSKKTRVKTSGLLERLADIETVERHPDF